MENRGRGNRIRLVAYPIIRDMNPLLEMLRRLQLATNNLKDFKSAELIFPDLTIVTPDLQTFAAQSDRHIGLQRLDQLDNRSVPLMEVRSAVYGRTAIFSPFKLGDLLDRNKFGQSR